MGILHKLTLALRRLDPGNQLWERVQRDEAANPAADTTADEAEIDCLVYALYGLTEAEVTTVQRALGPIPQTDDEEDAALLRAMQEADIDEPEDFASEAEVMATLQGNRGWEQGV